MHQIVCRRGLRPRPAYIVHILFTYIFCVIGPCPFYKIVPRPTHVAECRPIAFRNIFYLSQLPTQAVADAWVRWSWHNVTVCVRVCVRTLKEQESCAFAKMTARCADKSKETATPPPRITWFSVDSIQLDVTYVGVARTFSPQNFSMFPWE